MRIITTLALALVSGNALADDQATVLDPVIDALRQECAAFESGVLTVPDDAIQQTDLTGDGRGWVLDYGKVDCSSMASLSCGTGGCGLALVVDDHVTERLTKGWQVVDMPPYRVVLTQVHGSLCGGTNLTPCFEALVWDEAVSGFSTLTPREE